MVRTKKQIRASWAARRAAAELLFGGIDKAPRAQRIITDSQVSVEIGAEAVAFYKKPQ